MRECKLLSRGEKGCVACCSLLVSIFCWILEEPHWRLIHGFQPPFCHGSSPLTSLILKPYLKKLILSDLRGRDIPPWRSCPLQRLLWFETSIKNTRSDSLGVFFHQERRILIPVPIKHHQIWNSHRWTSSSSKSARTKTEGLRLMVRIL